MRVLTGSLESSPLGGGLGLAASLFAVGAVLTSGRLLQAW